MAVEGVVEVVVVASKIITFLVFMSSTFVKVVQFQFRKLMNLQNSLGLDCCTDPAFSDTIVLKNLMKPKLFGLWIVAQRLFSQIQSGTQKIHVQYLSKS